MLLPDISSLSTLTDMIPNVGNLSGGLSGGSQWMGPAAAVFGLSIARRMLFRGLGLFPLILMVGFMLFADHDARSIISGAANPLASTGLPSTGGLMENPAAVIGVIGVGLLFLTGGRFISVTQLLVLAGGAALYFNPPEGFVKLAHKWGMAPETLLLIGGGVLLVLWFLQKRSMYTMRYPGMWAHSLQANGALLRSLFNGAGILFVVGIVSILCVDRSLLSAVTPSIRIFLAPIALACSLTYLHKALPQKYKATITPLFWALACLILGYELFSHPVQASALMAAGGAHF